MKNSTLLMAALALTFIGPSVASANNVITDSQVRFEEDVLELRIEASETIREPRVRTAPGFVRIWFEDTDAARVDREGDGSSVRFVHIRPGVDESTVVIVRLMDSRRLDPDAITVQRDGQVVRVRVARAALGMGTPVAPPAAEPTAAEPAEPEAELEQEAPPAEEAVEAAAAPASTPLFADRPSAARPLVVEEGPSMITVLAFLLLLLGGAYLAISVWKSRRPGARRQRAIDIIAQKRVGVRHQLVVVRALGQDHLLAVHSGRTDHIASVNTPENDAEGIDLDGSTADLLPYLRLSSIPPNKGETPGQRVALRSERTEPVEERPRFGAELMRAAAQRTIRDSVSLASVGATSDAINGLLRLREKLGR